MTMRQSSVGAVVASENTTTQNPVALPHSERNIFFASGSSDFPASAKPIVQTVATLFKSEPRRQITLIGHSADQGSKEFSIALGQRRVEAVADELKKLGVPLRAIKRISYGSESDRARECKSDACLQEFRRVEILLGED